jgi:hypothetical protein
MPVAIVVLLLDISLIYHAAKTGRLQPWAFIILGVPLVGSLAYIVVELVPEWFGSPGAREARKRIAGKFDPEKAYRGAIRSARRQPTPSPTAGACSRMSQDRAVRRSRAPLRSRPHAADGSEPAYALGKANAQFGLNRPADARGRWTR